MVHEVMAGKRIVIAEVGEDTIGLTLAREDHDIDHLGRALPMKSKMRRISFEVDPAGFALCDLLVGRAAFVHVEAPPLPRLPVDLPLAGGGVLRVGATGRRGRALVTMAELDNRGRAVAGDSMAVALPRIHVQAVAALLRRLAIRAEETGPRVRAGGRHG